MGPTTPFFIAINRKFYYKTMPVDFTTIKKSVAENSKYRIPERIKKHLQTIA